MTTGLYLTDSYLKEFDAQIVGAEDGHLLLDRTAFYPEGGGQPSDTGRLTSPSGRSWTVTGVTKSADHIDHQVEGLTPEIGGAVHGEIDWERRYAHMRFHTCLHILSGVVFHRFGSDITGGQIYGDRRNAAPASSPTCPP